MAGFQILVIIESLLLWQLPRTSKAGGLTALHSLWVFPATYAILMGLQVAKTAGYTKRSLSSAGICFGYCIGNFVGPLTLRDQDAPGYKPAFIIVVVFSVGSAFLSLLYGYICYRENEARHESGIMEAFEHAYKHDLTGKKASPHFCQASPSASIDMRD